MIITKEVYSIVLPFLTITKLNDMNPIPKYKIDSKVYAISRYLKDGEDTNYLAIYEARVKSIYIEKDKLTNKIVVGYMLTTPNGDDYGTEVPEIDISTKFDILVKRIKPQWLAKSNTF